MCSLLSASRAGYYAWRERTPSDRDQKDAKLATQIRVIHKQSTETYGSPRIHAQLRHDGTRVGRKRVARIMRKERIDVRLRRRFRKTTDSKHGHPIAPNLLRRRFAVNSIRARDRVWASDITYIDTMEGWRYLEPLRKPTAVSSWDPQRHSWRRRCSQSVSCRAW
jgi:putative transposase